MAAAISWQRSLSPQKQYHAADLGPKFSRNISIHTSDQGVGDLWSIVSTCRIFSFSYPIRLGQESWIHLLWILGLCRDAGVPFT